MTQVVSPLRCAAVIGAGTMGRGIVISLANAGLQVLWLDNNPQMVEQGLAMAEETWAHNVAKGRIDAAEAAARRARIEAVDGYAALADADLVIEAVYENLELKQRIFRELDALMKPGAILASNTSALDVDAIAAVTTRPESVLGLHFFSPAHIMKLLEIVRGGKTAPAVLQAAQELGARMGKGDGFLAGTPARQGDAHGAAVGGKPQGQPPRARMALYLDRERTAGDGDFRLQRLAPQPLDHAAASSQPSSPSPHSTMWCSSGPASSSLITRPATDTPARTTASRSPVSR